MRGAGHSEPLSCCVELTTPSLVGTSDGRKQIVSLENRESFAHCAWGVAGGPSKALSCRGPGE